MQSILKSKNIVLAGLFNPSKFDKHYFIKNKIVLDETSINDASFFDTMAVQLISEKFNIIITFNQIILYDNYPQEGKNNIHDIAMKIANNLVLPQEIAAIGINLHWFLIDNDKSIEQISNEYFENNRIPVFDKYFNSPGTLFGAYASTDFKNSRLKLDIKPQYYQDSKSNTQIDGMGFNFNFHIDINERKGNEALHNIKEYELYLKHSSRIMSFYTND